ncbi:hypothetical protein [Williamsia sterculiae]|uniref:Uncharacterized protein n=1 Tax=Williamsia sterculiae TaxID=1344003 RepID=A0A1N7CPI3_9NOCA|nr:hypothetical protein [Williamsia sterculiae]SIR65548.1 hypothetical protein SAMN05445060_0276 [Williamsia sterculiae]
MGVAVVVAEQVTEPLPAVLATAADAVTETTGERGPLRDAMGTLLATGPRRLVVVAGPDHPDAFLAAVLSRLMIADRLDVEVGYVAQTPTPATVAHELPTGAAAAACAVHGRADTLPLIRDDTAAVLIGRARHIGVDGAPFTGETYVDSTLLAHGQIGGVLIEPLATAPGVRGGLDRRWRKGWSAGRAVQTGGVGFLVERDGILADRPVTRSTFYRHQQDWRLVRSRPEDPR